MSTFNFFLNGQLKTVEAPDDMPLLWVLRDLLGLTGTKYGCGVGNCRVCMVESEQGGRKRMVPACCTPVSEGMTIRTNTAEVIQARRTDRSQGFRQG